MKRVILAATVAALSFVGFADDEVVCYVNAGGSATAPYDTREKGAKSIYDCWQLDPKPTKIIICAGTTSGAGCANNRAEITSPLVIEGEDKRTSAVDERIWLKHEDAVMRNLTFLSQKWEGGGDTPSLFLTGALLTNVIVRNVNPYRYNNNGNGNGAVNAYSGARIIDCEIINNNINPTTGKQLCADGSGCSAIQIGNLQWPNNGNLKGDGVIIDHCIITNNMGGRVRAAGIVVANNYTPTPIVRNSLIAHNHMLNRTIPGVGAGIYAKGGLIVENCTIVSNDIAGAGAGVYAAANGLVISNSVVAFNVGVGEATTNEIAAADGVTAIWTNCLVPEGAEVTGEGLVRGDPLFNRDVNPNFPYWWLTAGSPAVDKGAAADWMTDATDLAGEARVVGTAVDIGAYEFDISLTDPLVVTGEPDEYATVEPAYGKHVHLTDGQQVPCNAPEGLVPSGRGDDIFYLCTGYVVYTNQTDSSEVWLESERGETTSYTHAHVTGQAEKLVWLWSARSSIGMSANLSQSSSVFGSSEIQANVTGIGKTSATATLTFKYGTARDALDNEVSVTVTGIGEWRGTLPHLRPDTRYYVQATLSNGVDADVTSEVFDFVQFDFVEPGGGFASDAYAARDHLIAQWDGIDNVGIGQHDASATTWKDVSGNGNDMTGITSYGSFAADGFLKSKAGSKVYSFGLNPETYEVFVDLSSYTSGGWIVPVSTTSTYYPTFQQTGSAGKWTFNLFYGANNKSLPIYGGFTVNLADKGKLAITCTTAGRYYTNGAEVVDHPYSNYWGDNHDNCFGAGSSGHSSGNTVNHKFCSIRFYDIVLTDTQRERNSYVDNVRFVRGMTRPSTPLDFVSGKFVATLPASDTARTVSIYWGETYGGTNGWGAAVETVTVPAGATTATFDSPAGWGKTVWFARAEIGDGADAVWSKTLIAEPPAALGMNETLTLASSAFGSSEIAAQVTGIGKTASAATLIFAYGTTTNCADGTVEVPVTGAGEWRGTIPHLIAGQTYYVKATLSNTTGDTSVTSEVRPFVQPKVAEPDSGSVSDILATVGFTANWQKLFDLNGLVIKPDWSNVTIGLGRLEGSGTNVDIDHGRNVRAKEDGTLEFQYICIPPNDSNMKIGKGALKVEDGAVWGKQLASKYIGKSVYPIDTADIDDPNQTYNNQGSVNGYKIVKVTCVISSEITISAQGGGFVAEFNPSADERSAYLCSGATYGGTNGWTTTSDAVTIDAGETTAAFDLPEGWGETVWYARVKIVEGDQETWSETLVALDANLPATTLADARAIGIDKLVLAGSLDSFKGDNCTLTPVVTDSSGAAIDFSSAVQVMSEPDSFAFELTGVGFPAAGETYSICIEATANGKVARSKTLTVAVGTAGTLTALDPSATAPIVVTVENEPDTLTTVVPAYGRYAAEGDKFYSFSTVASQTVDGREYSLVGYEVYDEGADEPVISGEGNAFTFAADRGGFRVVWKWDILYDVALAVVGGEHGSATADRSAVAHGGTARFTATPDEGYAVAWTGEGVPNEKMFGNELVLENVQGPVSAVATFFVPSSNEGPKTGLFAGYDHSAPVTFPGYDGTDPILDFPVLVRLEEGRGGFSYNHCALAGGLDVRFCDAAGVELASEVVKFDKNGTSDFWVKVPRLTNDARIFLVWGNADATARSPKLRVWGESFRGVWGLDAGRNVSPDKSPSGQHAVFHEAAVPLVQDGVVGEARHFTGTVGADAAFEEDSIVLVGNTDIDALQPATFTVSCWFRAEAYPAASAYATFMAGTASYDDGMWPNCFIGLDSSGHVIGCDRLTYTAPCLNTSYITKSDQTASLGEWHHFAYSLEADGKTRVYLDGVHVGSLAQNRTFDTYWGKGWANYRIPSFGMMRNFGDRVYSAARKRVNPFVGDLDEVRLTDGVRGDDWVRTEYLMIASNDTFVVVGAGGSLTVDGVPQPLARQIEASAANSEQDGVKKTCLGYSVVADGKTVASGDESSVSLAWPKNAQNVAVKWNWKTEYAVTVNGAVTWVEADSVFTVEAPAAPDEAQFFHSWEGDVPKFETYSPTFELGVTKPMALTATFAPVTRVTAADAEADVDALKNAINSVGKSATPVVVLVGDGVYTMNAASRAYQCVLTAPIVIRSVNGSAKTSITNTVDLGMFDASSGANKSAIVGFTLVGSTKASDNIIQIGKFKNTCFKDCVFDSTGKVTANNIALFTEGGWLSRCTIRNGTKGGTNGDKDRVKLTEVQMDSCVVSNNSQRVTPIWVVSKSRITNTIFANNVAESNCGFNGGAVMLAGRDNNFGNEDTVIENCTFVGNCNNSSTTGGKYGGALCAKVPIAVVNSAFANNSTAFTADGNDFYGPIAFVHSMSVDMPEGSLGSIKTSPAFKDGENPLYLPRATSASVDAGFATAAAADPAAKDLVGTNRVEGAAVDIGAVEFHSSPDDPFDVNVTPSAFLGRDTLSVSFAVTVAGNQGPVTYSWDFGDDTTSTEARPTHVYASSGSFTVTLTVTDTKTGKTATWTSGETPITILPSICYINAEGSSTYPYDTREKGAKSIADCYPIGPDKIVVCANTKADGDYVEVKMPLVIEGEDKYTSVVDERIWLQHKDAIMRNLTFKSTKYESNGDTPSLFVSYGMLTNIIVRNTDPHGFNGNEGDGAVNAYLGARIIDCEIVNNNMDENGARYRSGTGVAAIQIGNHHRPTEAIRDGGGVIIDHCIITNNMGGRYYGAAILVANSYSPAPIVRNSLIAGNRMLNRTVAGMGAGIYTKGALIVENCTIVSNDIAGAGAGVYAAAAGLEVKNSIVAYNVGGGEATTNEIAAAGSGAMTLVRTCVPEGAEVTGEGLVRGDPLLNRGVRTSEPYWSILGTSPCKNKGVNLDWMTPEATDLNGRKRVFNAKPDLGCYESQVGGMVIIVR